MKKTIIILLLFIFNSIIAKADIASGFRDPPYNPSKAYGGYFHMEYKGIEDRVVFGMSGYGGVSILIAPETSTITVINSLHYSGKKKSKFRYDERLLSITPIKDGI